jgi:hypothetical protein
MRRPIGPHGNVSTSGAECLFQTGSGCEDEVVATRRAPELDSDREAGGITPGGDGACRKAEQVLRTV